MSKELKPRLEVCFSPSLLPLYNIGESIVVIIDVLRATSTICTILYNGASRVIPVASVEECIRKGKETGAITAGERDGKIAPGLAYGNSPLEYPRELVEDKTIVLTTTNGTRLLHKASAARHIITGSFPNLSIVCQYLKQQSFPVILACAAWKDRVNLEDTLFAGAVVNRIKDVFEVKCDSALAAETLYLHYQHDLFSIIKRSSHYRRLGQFGLEKDIRYCITSDIAPALPVLEDGILINKKITF